MSQVLRKSGKEHSSGTLTRSGCREDWLPSASVPINNIVDITNYVMEEYGQPMHAYDLMTSLQDHEIVVRRAAHDEKFVTLDGQESTHG